MSQQQQKCVDEAQPRVCSTRLSEFVSCRVLELDAVVHVSKSRVEVDIYGRVRAKGSYELLTAVELPGRLAHEIEQAHYIFVSVLAATAVTCCRGRQPGHLQTRCEERTCWYQLPDSFC